MFHDDRKEIRASSRGLDEENHREREKKGRIDSRKSFLPGEPCRRELQNKQKWILETRLAALYILKNTDKLVNQTMSASTNIYIHIHTNP